MFAVENGFAHILKVILSTNHPMYAMLIKNRGCVFMRESPMAKQFKELLPEELKKTAHISFSNQTLWQIAAKHLQTLYGIYANPQFCIEHYYQSNEYKSNRQIIKRCKDIPEITIDDIHQMLKKEEEYDRIRKELLTIWEVQETPETIEKLARLLGVFPDQHKDTLYQYVVAKDAISVEEWPYIIKKVEENPDLLSVVTNILTKSFLPGYLLDFPANENVMTQPHNRYYYRGENAYYRHSKASLYRVTIDDRIPKSLSKFIALMRRYQCWDTLDHFHAVQHWGFSSINYIALAQHYGLKTEMLDITSDLKTALFFACCKFTPERKWVPLSKDDFAHRNSRAHISKNCNGDSRYGVLFRSPTELTDISWCGKTEDNIFGSITPIGYQPFMRCSQQHGYMLLTAPNDDLFLDKRFDKFKIRLNEDICNWIYNEMEQGNLVYPNNDVPDISTEIEGINKITTFSKTAFEEAAKDAKILPKDYGDLIRTLQKLGFEVRDSLSIIAPEKLEQINRNYPAEKAMQQLNVTPQLSPLMTLPKDTKIDEE